MRGTWHTGECGGGGGIVSVILVLVVVFAAGYGAVMVADAIATIMWLLVSVMFFAGCAVVGLAVRGNRRDMKSVSSSREIRTPRTDLPASRSARRVPIWAANATGGSLAMLAISAANATGALPPAGRHEHIEFHFHGVSAADVAAILAARNKENQ